jgi:hypothetical protein
LKVNVLYEVQQKRKGILMDAMDTSPSRVADQKRARFLSMSKILFGPDLEKDNCSKGESQPAKAGKRHAGSSFNRLLGKLGVLERLNERL